MSALALAQIWSIATLATPLHKLVLLRLADYADDRGDHPRALSLAALAAECNVERKEIDIVLRELQGDGWVILNQSARPNLDPPGYRLGTGKIRTVLLAQWSAEWASEIKREQHEAELIRQIEAKQRAKRPQPAPEEPSLLVEAEPETGVALAVVKPAPSNDLEKPDPRADELLYGALVDSPLAMRFRRWWAKYPRKAGKGGAWKAWHKIAPSALVLDQMMTALDWQIASDQWTKDGGDYIPHPSTYLNQRRWMDEPQEVTHRFTPRNQRNVDLIKKYSVTGQQRREDI